MIRPQAAQWPQAARRAAMHGKEGSEFET